MTDIIHNSLWSVIFACCLLRQTWSSVPHRSSSDHGGGDISIPPGLLYSWVAGRLSLALCMCECQTGGHRGGDLRIGKKLLAKALLEVPLAQFSICSRRVETQQGGRWSAECRLPECGGISRSCNDQLLGGWSLYMCLVYVRGTLPHTSASVSLSVLTQCLFRVVQARQNVGITVSAYVLLSTPVRLRACVHRRLCVCIDSNEGFWVCFWRRVYHYSNPPREIFSCLSLPRTSLYTQASR